MMLTERENQILSSLSKGKLNKEIAMEHGITIDTVKKHVKNIYRKINVRNRVEAILYINREKNRTGRHK